MLTIILFIVGFAMGYAWSSYKLINKMKDNPTGAIEFVKSLNQKSSTEDGRMIKRIRIEMAENRFFAYDAERGTFIAHNEYIESLIADVVNKLEEYQIIFEQSDT